MSDSLRIALAVAELFTAQGLSKNTADLPRSETRRKNTRTTTKH